MKRKIRLIDNINKKVLETEVEVRDLSHLDAQIRFPHLIQEDKRFKKPKHKKRQYDDEY